MRSISLEAMVLTAFRCFHAETVIEFPTEPGLNFLAGVNKVVERLGSNGAGKSTLWDALCWCWYGLSIRGERASELASWGLGQRPNVATSLLIDGTSQIIERTGSPDVLLLNGEPVPQATIDSLLGLSRLRFLHSVVYAQGNDTLFMDLSVPARGDLLGEMLDLDYWSRMSTFAGQQADEQNKQANEVAGRLQYEQGRLSAYETRLNELCELEFQWEYSHREQLLEAETEYRRVRDQLEETKLHIDRAKYEAALLPDDMESKIEQLREELNAINVDHGLLSNSWTQTSNDVAFLQQHTTCPTCAQPITARFVDQRLAELNLKLEKDEYDLAELNTQKEAVQQVLQEQLIESGNLMRTAGAIQGRLAGYRAEYQVHQQALTRAEQYRKQMQTEATNPHTEQMEPVLQNIAATDKTIAVLSEQLESFKSQAVKYEYWRKGFRLVRLFITGRILAMLEIETAAAAASLGVGNWKISFATERETASGTVRPGVHITVTNPDAEGSYKSYSFGEAQRIKLAVSLGLGSLIQKLAGVNYNFEVWDEPTAWLSAEGIDDLVNALQYRADTSQRVVWLLDHRSVAFPFDAVYQVTKQIGGSMVHRVG